MVVAVSIFIAAILDLRMFIAISKYQINHFPMPRSFCIFDTMFLNIHEAKCQKKEILLQLVQGCDIFQVRMTRLCCCDIKLNIFIIIYYYLQLGEGTAKETPEQKFNRLQHEMRELAEELDHIKVCLN